MKYAKRMLFVLALILSTIVIAQTEVSRKIIELRFNSTTSYTLPMTVVYPALNSVDMTFTTGASVSNTFTMSYVRSNVTHRLYTIAGTYTTVAWYPENSYFFKTGDRLVYSNTSPVAALVTLNITF